MLKKMLAKGNCPRSLLLLVASFAVAASQIGPSSAQDTRQEPRAQLVMQLGHSGAILSVAFSPDGRTALSGGQDGAVKLWDVASGRLIRTFTHAYMVRSVAFSPDGRTAVSGSSNFTMKLWDIDSGREIRTFSDSSQEFTTVAFSPDGRTVLSGNPGGTVKLWDITSGRILITFPENRYGNSVSSVAFSPDGRTVLSGSNDKITLWDVSTGRETRTLTGHSDAIKSVAFSPDGRTALSGSKDKSVKLWDVSTGREISTFTGHADEVDSVAFSPDGRTALSASKDKTVKLWDIPTGREIKTFGAYPFAIFSVVFSPDGQTFLLGAAGSAMGLIDVGSGRVLRAFSGHSSRVGSIAFAPDGHTALSPGNRNDAKLWDVASGREIRTFAGHTSFVTSVAFSPDGRTALTGSADKTIKLWDVESGHEIRTFTGHSDRIETVAFSPDGRTVASGSFDRTFKLWDAASGQELRSFADRYAVLSVALSPDGRLALSKNGGADQGVKLWDTTTGEFLRFLPDSGDLVASLAFSPDGRTALAAFSNGSLVQWDTADWHVRKTLAGNSRGFMSAAFSLDRRTVLSGNLDGTIRVLDTDGGRELKTFKGKSETIVSVALAPDGRTALTGGDLLHLWNIGTGTERAAIVSFYDGSWLTITPEGFFDASSPKAAQNLNIVRGLEVSSVDQVYDALYRPDLVREKLAGDPNGKVKAAAAQLDLDKVMASGMAPRVTVVSPASGSSSSTDEVAVEAVVADQGGGIGNVEWRVNGVTLGLESRGLERLDTSSGAAGRTQTVKRTLALESGENRIEVLAYNAKGLIASEPGQITIKWDSAKTASPPKLYVLAVGVNDYYDGRLHLAYAVPDATALADAFKKAGSGLYASVEVETVLDKEVTLANLDKVFADLSHKVQPRDVFVFFLAGHGKTKNGRYYFLPRDFRYEDESSIEKAGMGQDKFQAWFAAIQARKSLLLYDTCESGSLTGATRGSDIDERLGALNRMARATGRTFLTATTDDAPALEGYRGHGVFTYALLDALARADVNNNGLIEVSELADYIDQKVPDYSFEAFKLRQIPQRSIVGNNFPLSNKTDVMAVTTTSDPGSIPVRPTHVVVSGNANVFENADSAGRIIQKLPAGALVSIVRDNDGWAQVATNGKAIGFVAHSQLAPIQ